jgi:glycosyltransferase involved in cell wall biosynthesis
MGLKVLYVLNEIRFSGAETNLRIAAPCLKRGGVELHALSTGEVRGDYAPILNNAGYTIHHLPFRKSPLFLLDLFRLLKKERFDVIHLQAERAFFWYSLAARLAGARKIIRTIQNSFSFSGYLRIKRALQRWIARDVLGVLFVSVSNSVAETEINRFRNKTVVIPNWTDREAFFPPKDPGEKNAARQKLALPEDKIILVSVGACLKQKNHAHILSALAMLPNQRSCLLYLHVGDGPLAETESSHASELGLLNSVRFAGQIENVREPLIASDVFVMPSDFEGMPVAALEAMSCGLTSIVYDVSGLRDAVQNGRSGIVVDPDPKPLSEAIERLLSDSGLRQKMGKEALSIMDAEFNMEECVRKYLNLYQSNSGTRRIPSLPKASADAP